MFSLGIECKKILVVPDDEQEICDAVELMKKYDFVVTSGGIGPTHDDVTYESLAKAFDLPVKIHHETAEKMRKLGKSLIIDGEAREAQLRMATFPTGDDVDVLFLREELWVPVVGLQKKFYILPGVPQLFEKLLDSLTLSFDGRISDDGFFRYFVKTMFKESEMAPHLSKLQKQVGNDVKIGSYPHMGQGFNTVSILGKKKDDQAMRKVVEYCVKNLEGQEIGEKEERQLSEKIIVTVE
jgi:molybdopterin-biosynthesis enzyme MoeA-like protein